MKTPRLLAMSSSNPRPNRIAVPSMGYYHVGEVARAPAPPLVGLHGYAQRGDEFLEILTTLAGDRFVPVAPQGFHQIRKLRSGEIVFSWMTSYEKADGIERNNLFLSSMLDRLEEEGIASPGKAILLGFSQGSSVAFRFAQSHPDRVAGVVSVSSDLPPDVKADLSPLASVPVLVAYSPDDRIVDEEHPLAAIDALQSAGIAVEAFKYEGDHRVPSSLASPIQSWAENIIGIRGD